MSTASAKQQVIQKIKENTNILVTVSRDPSVDELSAALGLTLFLNELGKHATAVFSGKIPPAINFLEPNKTFEDTADSLRDFIIALDKEKADHLRYKIVDDAVVKIFITPYRTTITEADLEFSQGDYNIELVLALNVEDSNHLDEALTAHGKILHSADVVTVTARDIKSSLGAIDWHERNASGVSEMLLELVDELKTVKATLDEQMANAFMTGIVAVTNRFSNNLTSPRVMTAAAYLMAAGANQQLIAAKLVEAEELEAPIDEPEDANIPDESPDTDEAEVDNTKLSISRSSRKQPPKKSDKELPKPDDGTLEISHQKRGDLDEVARRTQAEAQDEAARAAESYLEKQLAKSTPEEPVESEEPVKLPEPEYSLPAIKPLGSPQSTKDELPEPSVGGTFNASTEQAAEDKKREAESGRNRTILNHGQPGSSQGGFSDSPINATVARHNDEPKSVDPFAETNNNMQSNRSISPLGEASTIAGHNGDVMAALSEDTSKVLGANQPLGQPSHEAVSEALAAVPNVPDPLAPTSAPGVPTLAEIESSTKNIAGLPPMPDFSTLPELPAAFPPAPAASPAVPSVPAATPPAVNNTNSEFNPTQFQIPGQN